MQHQKILVDQITPVEIYSRVKKLFPNEVTFLFESAISSESGSYSFILVGAKERIVHKAHQTHFTNSEGEIKEVDQNPLLFLKEYYKSVDQQKYRELALDLEIGYVDGFIGYIGYDMVKEFEPRLKTYMNDLEDQLGIPDLDMMRPHLVLAYSHKSSKLTMVSETSEYIETFEQISDTLRANTPFEPLKRATIMGEPTFSLSQEEFYDRIDRAKEMIKSGDVFQILVANRFTQKGSIDPFSFYRVLRSKNPSPYMFFLEFESFTIAGSSPEVMVGLSSDGEILLRPIAGTRKRGKTRARDLELEAEMLADEKERAEHLMLVDLGRNDVGRVAAQGSVKVPELMRVERYSHVMHMVSDVNAMLDEKYDMFDLFMATFTAGTMTGAPKIRAMELIAEFEGQKRNFYSGSIGYFGFDGNMDSAITIRTSLVTDDQIVLQSGAGVVADSINELEYLEIRNKMNALISSIKDLENL
jgi:anthranilate synthase component 1